MAVRIQITDLDKNGQEILPLTPVIASPQTIPLPIDLDCRSGIDNRHILIEAFAEGARFAEAVRGNFCLMDEGGLRTIVVYLARPSQMYPDADRFNAFQQLVHAG